MSNTPKIDKDMIIGALKAKWLTIAPKENYPHTPEITKELDNLEEAIREFNNDKKTKNK